MITKNAVGLMCLIIITLLNGCGMFCHCEYNPGDEIEHCSDPYNDKDGDLVVKCTYIILD
ncbi:hypothetical protein HDR66_00700 [bacterium]|nr:hypothetical protein [bacterium]